MTIWQERKPLDELTNLIAAYACVEIGWKEYGRSLSKQVDTQPLDDLLLNSNPLNYTANVSGQAFLKQRLYYQAVKDFEKAGNVRRLWKMGTEQLQKGLMEKACEAFRAIARVILSRDI